jgi:HSP20 family protein
MTPWSSGPLFPLSNRLFTSRLERFPSTIGLDDAFKDDFYEDDSLMPAMNIKEHKKDFEIEFAAPGFDKKDFEITIRDDVLHIRGEKSKKEAEEEEDFSRKEFSYKSFRRSTSLPESIDLDQKIKATYKNGILKVFLLKKEDLVETPKKVIEIE